MGKDILKKSKKRGAALKKEIRKEILVSPGNRLIEVRGVLGLNQKKFALSLDVSSSYLSDIELGKTRPSFDFLVSCYIKYKLNPSWIIVGEGEMFLNREAGKKVCEYDLGEQSEFMHEILGIMEKSKYCRNYLTAVLMRTYYEQEDTIKRDLKREAEKLE